MPPSFRHKGLAIKTAMAAFLPLEIINILLSIPHKQRALDRQWTQTGRAHTLGMPNTKPVQTV